MKRTGGFCEKKFRSMLLSGTLTMAILYIMLLCDNIIAGYFFGGNGVAAINTVTPVTGATAFLSNIIPIGSGILYSRRIGAMEKRRADEIFGQGLILSIGVAAASALLLILFRSAYFRFNGVEGEIYELAVVYYRWMPLNAALSVPVGYLTQMVYTDGDEVCNNVAYLLQIGGNLLFSILLAPKLGMLGIILGTIIGNALGLCACIPHFFRKSNTLRFVWHFSWKDLLACIQFSIVDAAIYLCWAAADYVVIGHVAARYGDAGLVTLAVVISLIEFGVVLDGIGMAVQPLLGTYLGEKNNGMSRRLMHAAEKAAVFEGLIATVLLLLFAKPFCALFGITGDAQLAASARAVRIVSLGMVFCSILSLMTSYYMMVDHVALSVGVTVLKDGLFYSVLPVFGSLLFGEIGLWAALAAAPLLALLLSMLYVRIRYGKKLFPHLLGGSGDRYAVFEDVLRPETCVRLSEQVQSALRSRGYSERCAVQAALFTEEIGLTVLEKNRSAKRPVFMEISLLFEDGAVQLVERDTGVIFDAADPDLKVDGLSSFVLNGLLLAHRDKNNLTTTGCNRNIIRFQS